MRTVDLIAKKRDGFELSRAELEFLIRGYIAQEIPDYQLSAWLMAVYFRGMSAREMTDFTWLMAHSGTVCDLHMIDGKKADKHSTGGVADTTTLIVAPIVAAAGVTMAKMSGRGLGHTGGTIDKLESLPGFCTSMTNAQFIAQLQSIGLAVMGQTQEFTPADQMLYALRDVTATVPSIPLIASSIMSKKIAAGADVIVLDVKVGDGAFMNSVDEALQLARAMVDIGKHAGRATHALISDMNQPLGAAIGNILEMKEALAVLRNEQTGRLRELSLALAARIVWLAGQSTTFAEAETLVNEVLASGQALARFRAFVRAQGGSEELVLAPERFPTANQQIEITAQTDGYLCKAAAKKLGHVAMLLGAGRKDKRSQIDLTAGIVMKKQVGDEVRVGESLCWLHTNMTDDAMIADCVRLAEQAFAIEPIIPSVMPLFYGWVSEEGFIQKSASESN